MPKVRFTAKKVSDQEPLPNSGVDKNELEVKVGTLDIEDVTIVPVLEALRKEALTDMTVEAWKQTDNQHFELVARRPGLRKS